MRINPAVFIGFAVLTLILVGPAAAPANPTYTLTTNPSVPVNLGTTVTLTITINNGSPNQVYSISLTVIKPNATGQATTIRNIAADNRGRGSTMIPYPDPSFTPTGGTVATDVGGAYTVNVNQTGPSFAQNVVTGQFTVISQLTIVLSQPAAGTYIQRGQTVTITATISSPSGPVTTATAVANTPPNGRVYLQEISAGVYQINYQVLMYDTLGPWSVQVTATDPSGNTGASIPTTISITKSDLVIDGLTTYTANGTPTTSFSHGDTIVPFFRLRYSNGVYITAGQYQVAVKNPSGVRIANLTAVYEASKFGFSTPTGYPISSSDPGGSWTVAIEAGSVNDGFGNTGPNFSATLTIGVVTVTSPFSYLPFAIGALLAILVGAVVVKRIDKSSTGFGHLEELMGGPIPRSTSVLLLGDPGSGKSIFCYQFLYEELENGRHCTLLSYDVFPEDVQARMKEFGWEITSQLRKGRLKIIDCYSGLAGEGEGAIKDPSDLTELNIRVTSIISRAKGAPVTLVLDSLAPIFNGVEGKQAVMFLQTVSAKIKKTGGIFYMTGPTGAIPADSLAKIKSMTDGLIELSLVRENRKVSRYLTVVKMERRRISSEAIPFEIDRRKGIVFQVSRVRGALSKIQGIESNAQNVLVPKVRTPAQLPQLPQSPHEGMGILARLKSVSDKFWQVPSSTILDQKTIPKAVVFTKDIGVKDSRASESLDPRNPKFGQESVRTISRDVKQNPVQLSSKTGPNATPPTVRDSSSSVSQGSTDVTTLSKKVPDPGQPIPQSNSSSIVKNSTQLLQDARISETTPSIQASSKPSAPATTPSKQDIGKPSPQPNATQTTPPKKEPGQPSPSPILTDVKRNPAQDPLQSNTNPVISPKKSKPQNPKPSGP